MLGLRVLPSWEAGWGPWGVLRAARCSGRRPAASVTGQSYREAWGWSLLITVTHFISTRERDFHLVRTESGRGNLVLEGLLALHCENRRYYGLGMAMCKASLPADVTLSK